MYRPPLCNVVCALLYCLFFLGQPAVAQIHHLHFKKVLSTAEGNKHPTTCAAQGVRGNLWFGTRGQGVLQYNGTAFTKVLVQELGTNKVMGMAFDAHGKLWVCGRGQSLWCYDTQRDSATDHSSGIPTLKENLFTDIAFLGGEVWVSSTKGGVYRLDTLGQLLQHYPEPAFVASLAVHKDRLYYTASKGVWGWMDADKDAPVLQTVSDTSALLSCLFFAPKGELFIGSFDKGVFCALWDGDDIRYDQGQTAFVNEGLSSRCVTDISGVGQTLFLSTGDGLTIYQIERQQIDRHYRATISAHGLSSNGIINGFVSADSTLWLMTNNNINALHWGGQQFAHFKIHENTINELPSYHVNRIRAWGDELYLSTYSHGLLWLDAHLKLQTVLPPSSILPLGDEMLNVTDFLKRDGRSFIGTNKGLVVMEQGRRVRHLFQESKGAVLWLEDLGSLLFVMTKSKAYTVNPKSLEVKPYIAFSPFESSHDYAPSENALYIVHKNALLLRLKTSGDALAVDTLGQLPVDASNNILVRQNRLWVVGHDSIHSCSMSPLALESSISLGKLKGSHVFLEADKEGVIWMATSSGNLYSLDAQKQDVRHYAHESGYLSCQFTSVARFGHRVVFGSDEGITATLPFRPVASLPDIRPTVFISHNGRVTDGETLEYDESDRPRLKVDLHSHDYRQASSQEYRFQLLGYDSVARLSGQPNVSYAGLPSGVYALHFAYRQPHGDWVEGEPISIRISPPRWKTTYAIGLCIVGLLAMGMGATKWLRRPKPSASDAGEPVTIAEPQSPASEDKTPALNKKDAAFVVQLESTVRKNLGNVDFNTAMLAEEMAVSRRQLFRKIKALLDTTPAEYILSIKIEEAKRLLTEEGLNVTETSEALGFQYVSSFSQHFSKAVGKSPKNYKLDGE